MNTMEKKVNALINYVLCETPEGREKIRIELYRLTQKNDNPGLDSRINGILNEVGVPANLKGYRYIHTAIKMVVNDCRLMESITKGLYPGVAKAYDTTPSRVERAIRHAIEMAWDRGDYEAQQKYFGNSISADRGKPCNGEFIARIGWILSHDN